LLANQEKVYWSGLLFVFHSLCCLFTGIRQLQIVARELKIVLFPYLEITHLVDQESLEVEISCC